MSGFDGPHEFVEDVEDYSMCMCGTPAMTHYLVEPKPDDVAPGGAS